MTSKISYWTDNGSYFSCAYWGSWRPGNVTATQVLRELRAWHASQGLHFGTYQLDPWWTEDSDGGTDCGIAVNWTAKQSLFPGGLEALGGEVPLTLYMNYFAPLAQGNQMSQGNAARNDKYGLGMGQLGTQFGEVGNAQDQTDFGDYQQGMAPINDQFGANQMAQGWKSDVKRQVYADNTQEP